MESSQSVSGSGVERYTLPPPRISVESDGGSPATLLQVSFLLSLGPRALVPGFCIECFAAHILHATILHARKTFSRPPQSPYWRAHYPWHTRNVSLLGPRPEMALTGAYTSNSDDGQAPKVSETQKNCPESSCSHTGFSVRSSSPSGARSPSSHTSTVSLHSVVSIPTIVLINSSTSTPLYRSTHSLDAAVRASSKHTKTQT